MKYQVQVKHHFCAIHSVPDDPDNAIPHSHSWVAVVVVDGPLLDSPLWVMDFKGIEHILGSVLQDGSNLNDIHASGTVEAIASVLDLYIRGRLPDQVALVRFELHETDDHAVFILDSGSVTATGARR